MATKKKITKEDAPREGEFGGMLLMQLSISRFAESKKGDVSEIDTGADKDLLSLSKRLLECPERKAIKVHDNELYRWFMSRSVPSLFKTGIYQIRPDAASEINEYLEEKKAERVKLVEAFVEAYSETKSMDRKRLGPQFRETDYPPEDVLRSKFQFSWRFFTMGPPSDLEKIDPKLFAQEKERIADLIEEAKIAGLCLIREAFKELVDHLVEKLTPDADGTRKRFFASNIEKVREFFEAFKLRDIANDKDLEALVGKAKDLLEGIDAKQIRTSNELASQVKTGFAKIQKNIDTMIKKGPKRKIDPSAF